MAFSLKQMEGTSLQNLEDFRTEAVQYGRPYTVTKMSEQVKLGGCSVMEVIL